MAAVAGDVPRRDDPHLRVMRVAGIVGVVGLLATGLGVWLSPDRALLAYLFAYITVAAIAMGGLVLLLIGYTTNARWLAALRRLQEALAITFPALFVLFIPIALGVRRIYPWAWPHEAMPARLAEAVEKKRAWLEPGAFVVRGFLYLAVFAIAAETLRRWSLARDRVLVERTEPAEPDGPVEPIDIELVVSRERVFSAAMLPPVGLAVTFAAFDWVMSLQPTWYSSIFGIYYFAAGFVAAIGVVTLLAWQLQADTATLALTGNHFHALGRMLFGFVVFWTYTSYFQGFLIQIANKPTEVTFFLARTRGGWGFVLSAVVLLRFVLPFFLLLPRRLKFIPSYTGSIALVILVGHVLDMYWLVIPASEPTVAVWWVDIAALAGIAGVCIAFAAWRQRGVSVVPLGDPLVPAGLRYASPT